jgi:membrane protein
LITHTLRKAVPPGLVRLIARVNASRGWCIVKQTIGGTFADGFVHAGNIAYLSLLTLFPFFIVVATVAGSLGRTDDGTRVVATFLRTVPRDVAELIQKPIADVIAAQSNSGLLTVGLLLTLWSVSGFIETIREIIRKSYGAKFSMSVWRYRVLSIGMIVAAVLLMLIAFIAQVVLTGVEEFVVRLVPFAGGWSAWLGVSRIAPALMLFIALWLVFYTLTPKKYRHGSCPIWPGALLTMIVWVGTTMLLPVVIGAFGGYGRTYGSLAGVIVALLFFYIIGLALVVGAHLNAALAIVPKSGQKQPDDPAGVPVA